MSEKTKRIGEKVGAVIGAASALVVVVGVLWLVALGLVEVTRAVFSR